jgi:hypothetical protein
VPFATKKCPAVRFGRALFVEKLNLVQWVEKYTQYFCVKWVLPEKRLSRRRIHSPFSKNA